MTSFYTSLNALRNAETDLGVIAHNIANAETLAFKSRSVQFADIVAGGSGNDPRLSVGLGATVSTINQDFSLGAIEQTGRSLDVAIDSDGFFSVRNRETNEFTFTRNGNFQIDSDGNIEDARGQPIQTFAIDPATGLPLNTTPIDTQVPTVSASGSDLSSVTVEGNGNLLAAYADGEIVPIGRLSIATFASNDGLLAIGQGRNRATGVSGQPQYESPGVGNRGSILSGALERSNVDLAEEMVALITAQRNFQANARAIDTATAISQTVINLQG